MRTKSLTDEQIQKAKLLHQEGYTKRQLAKLFSVGGTTIWENVFSTQKRVRVKDEQIERTYSTIRGVVVVVTISRQQGLNSQEVSKKYFIPLEEVNYIYSNYGTANQL